MPIHLVPFSFSIFYLLLKKKLKKKRNEHKNKLLSHLFPIIIPSTSKFKYSIFFFFLIFQYLAHILMVLQTFVQIHSWDFYGSSSVLPFLFLYLEDRLNKCHGPRNLKYSYMYY